MKTAILISGAMRTLDKCLPNLHWMVFRHFPGADFYISTVQDEDAAKSDLIKKKYPGSHVEISIQNKQPEFLLPEDCPNTWTHGQPYTHEPYFISVSPQAVIGQLWQLENVWQLYQATKKERHDLIIRCRPDLWFHSFKPPVRNWELLEDDIAFTPFWGRFGGANDRFAIMRRGAAMAYFTTFRRIKQLWNIGCPIHPESLIYASLREADCHVEDSLLAEFSTLRKNGEMRPPEISVIDLAHLKVRC